MASYEQTLVEKITQIQCVDLHRRFRFVTGTAPLPMRLSGIRCLTSIAWMLNLALRSAVSFQPGRGRLFFQAGEHRTAVNERIGLFQILQNCLPGWQT